MTRFLLAFVILATASAASAQTLEGASSRQLVVDGVPGVWTPMPTFRAMVADLDALSVTRASLLDHQSLVLLLRADVADLTLARDSALAELVLTNEELTATRQDEERARERLSRARGRIGWSFGAGTVVAVVLAALLASLVP